MRRQGQRAAVIKNVKNVVAELEGHHYSLQNTCNETVVLCLLLGVCRVTAHYLSQGL